ncbi:MAG TPA: flippase [Terriglobales bacterium]|nr:flippase [Terriglobales bacterium]
MNPSQRVGKNIAWMLVAGGVGAVLQMLAVLLAARGLPLNDFGTFNYLISFAIVFQFLTDFGLTNILTREVARHPDNIRHLLGSAKGLMWALFCCSTALLLGTVLLLNLPLTTKAQSFVMGLASLTVLQAISYSAVLRAVEDMEFNAIGFTLHKGLFAGFVGLSLACGWGLWGVVLSHLASCLIFWSFNWWIVSSRLVRASPTVDLALWKSMLFEAVPLGSGLVLRQFAWQADVLILVWLVDPNALGLFSGPYRILLGARMLSMAFALPLYPAMIRSAQGTAEKFTDFYNRSMKWFCCLSVPGALLFIIWPRLLINVLLGQKFIGAESAMQWFGFAFVPMFVSSLSPFIYTALRLPGVFCWAMVLAMLVRVGADLAVVPHLGYVGGSVVAVFSEIGAFALLAYFLERKGYPLRLADFLVKPLLAGLVMAAILLPAKQLGLLPALPVFTAAGIAYLGVLFLLRTFSDDEVRLMREGLSFLSLYLRKSPRQLEGQG